MSRTRSLLLLGLTLSLSSCVLLPQGEKELRQELNAANKELGIDSESPPELSSPVTKDALLERILLANGNLRGKYYQWQAAHARLMQVATYPNSNIAPNLSFQTEPSAGSSFDRTAINLGFDPMFNLKLPGKVKKEGQIALTQAQLAGSEFQELKLSLRSEVLSLYFDLVFLQQRMIIEKELVSLFEFLSSSLQGRSTSGSSEAELLQGELRTELAKNSLENLVQEEKTVRAKLNGLLRRAPEAPLAVMPETNSDEEQDITGFVSAGVERNPSLQALSHAVAGAEYEVERALLEFVPDINPSFMIIGNAERAVGAMVVLPTTLSKLKAAVDESRMRLQAIKSIQAQKQAEEKASFAATLISFLNTKRESKLYRDTLLPIASRFAALSEERFLVGRLDSNELLAALELYFEVKTKMAEVLRAQDQNFTKIETLAGITYQEYFTQLKRTRAQLEGNNEQE